MVIRATNVGEQPYPVLDAASLDARAQEIWLDWHDILPKAGHLMCFRRGTTPARVHRWPDSTGPDQAIGLSLPDEFDRIVPHDSTMIVIFVAPDGFGNPWCLVIAAGIVGFVACADMEAPERRKPCDDDCAWCRRSTSP